MLILNRTRYRCSNNLHAVFWHSALDIEPEISAIGFLTSAVSVWAEIYGRRYGGGVLKMDLGTLARVPVPLASHARGVFEEIDHLLRSVLKQGLGIAERDVTRLQRALRELSAQRVPAARRGSGG
jgi:hypothetical protein